MGNVYMEADQVRFKDSTYRDVQTALAAALEGGGGGGTTVVANPEGSATADLAKLQVGETIYGIPAEAGDISYDNTSSGMTADDVQEAIDELSTGIGGITELIPSDATSSNKLATADDIPDAVTGNPSGSATAGNLTKLQIGSDIYSVPSGGARETVSVTADGTETYAQLFKRLGDLVTPSKLKADSILTVTSGITSRCLPMARLDTAGGALFGCVLGMPIYWWTAAISSTLAYCYYNYGVITSNTYAETDMSSNVPTAGDIVTITY